jgi:hypothetical protein
MRVVVARDEMPLHARKLPHALNWAEKHFEAWVHVVVDVAGHEYGRSLFCDGDLADAPDNF